MTFTSRPPNFDSSSLPAIPSLFKQNLPLQPLILATSPITLSLLIQERHYFSEIALINTNEFIPKY